MSLIKPHPSPLLKREGKFGKDYYMERTLVIDIIEKVGETVKLQGWVDTKRDHGKLTFIDLRDRTGKVQCVGFQKMGELTVESVVELIGTVKKRP